MKLRLTLIILFFLSNNAYCLRSVISVNQTRGCAPMVVNVTDNSVGNITSWIYYFGDGNSSTNFAPTYTYTKAGIYILKQYISDGTSTDSMFITITVLAPPTSDFTVDKNKVCTNELLKYTYLAKRGDTTIRTATWDFGDGRLSNFRGDVERVYLSSGIYDVSLTVRDNNGCVGTKTISNYMTIYESPKAQFYFNKKYSCQAPMNVNFVNQSSTNSNTYFWDLGNGVTTNVKNPATQYTKEDKYEIKLTTTTRDGCSHTQTQDLNVKFGNIKADFETQSYKVCAPATVNLTNKTSPTDVVYDYQWKINNTNVATTENYSFPITKPGVFTIEMRVNGTGNNCYDSIIKTIIATDKPKPELIVKDTLGCNSFLATTFEAKFNYGEKWKFTINGEEFDVKFSKINYFFNKPGIYNSFVTITDSGGCVGNFQFNNVYVQQINDTFGLKDSFGCVPYAPQIKNFSTCALPSPLKYEWDFNDGGAKSNLFEPKRTFTKQGYYKINLKATDQYGCVENYHQILSVGDTFDITFESDKDTICNKERIVFTNTTDPKKYTKNIHWEWSFGGTNGYDGKEFRTEIYREPGYYSLVLKANHNGCRVVKYKDSMVFLLGPFAELDYDFDTCYSRTFKAISQSKEYTDLRWEINNTFSTADSIIYTIPNHLNYAKVKLTAFNINNRCPEMSVERIVNEPTSTAKIEYVIKGNCTPLPINFKNIAKTFPVKSMWYFGNGDSSSQHNDFDYIYKNAGVFNVKLATWNQKNCYYEDNRIINILGPSTASNVYPLSGCIPLKVNFMDSIVSPNIKRKKWLVDGIEFNSNNNGQSFEYEFQQMPKNGDSVEILTLVVEDKNGCISTKDYRIRLSGPKSNTSIEKFGTCANIEYHFKTNLDSISTAMPVQIHWDLGDGTKYDKDDIKHVYKTKGTRFAKLKIEDRLGCIFEEQYYLNVLAPELMADFEISNTEINCPPLEVQFTNKSTFAKYPIINYQWKFGDSTGSFFDDPGKVYTKSGLYDVSLKVTNTLGCSHEIKKEKAIKVGGPTAIFKIETNEGCLPFKPKASLKTNYNCNVLWDMGNGETTPNSTLNFTYNKAGKFFPKIILRDSLDCENIIVLNDSFTIYNNPKADFEINQFCLKTPVLFKNKSLINHNSGILFSNWSILNNNFNINDSLIYKFNDTGTYRVKLRVNNTKCKDSIEKNIRIFNPKALFNTDKLKYCEGETVKINNQSFTQTNFQKFNWYVNNNLISDIPEKQSFLPGFYELKMIVFDEKNCSDTFAQIQKIKFIDTLINDNIDLKFVSVSNNKQIKIVYDSSLIDEFEKYNLWHFENNDWQKVNESLEYKPFDFDFNKEVNQSHCFKITHSNKCKAENKLENTKEHCSIFTQAKKDTNAILVNWTAYIGLNINQYDLLRKTKNTNENFTLIHSEYNPIFEYKDTNITCLKEYEYVIIGKVDTIKSFSNTDFEMPIWKNKLPIPLINFVTVENDKEIKLKYSYPESYQKSEIEFAYIFDILHNKEYQIPITEKNWHDLSKNTQEKSYLYKMKVSDNCGDSSSYTLPSKTIFLSHKNIENEIPELNWNSYLYWEKGVKVYQIERKNNTGEYDIIGYTNDTFYQDKTADVTCVNEYNYRVKALHTDSQQYYSQSNYNILLAKSYVFVPNAFTPNQNSLNEIFAPKGQFVYNYQLEIYDRWGQLIYVTTDCFGGWDGNIKNEPAPEGVYLYKLRAFGNDYKKYYLSGTLHLLR